MSVPSPTNLVRQCLVAAPLNGTIGDEDKAITSNFAGGVKYTKQSTAYMLVYIRVSDWDRIMCPADKDDISEPIRKRLEVCIIAWVLF